MAKKRGNHEGSISKRSNGLYMARISVTELGKRKQVCFYGRTRQEVADKLAKALHDKQQGTFVKPHKLTLGNWLDTWLHEYKRPRIRAITFDTYTMIIRRHLKPALGHLCYGTCGQNTSSATITRRLSRGWKPAPSACIMLSSPTPLLRLRRINWSRGTWGDW